MKRWTRWYPALTSRVPVALYRWLSYQGSLTQRLQKYVQADLSITLLSNHLVCPSVDEARLLKQRSQQLVYQREVHLQDDERPLVYARTIVPASTYKKLRHRFDGLGNRSLGEMLFNDPGVTRGCIEVARLQPGQYLFQCAAQYLADMPLQLWGRRSCFYIAGNPLLVNEIFLPSALWN